MMSPSRLADHESHRLRRRERVLVAARSILEATGHADKVSMQAIAGVAGMSVGALYLLFESRDVILADLLSDEIAAGAEPRLAVGRYIPKPLAIVVAQAQQKEASL